MNRVTLHGEALRHNLAVIDGWMRQHDAHWTVVTKLFCGYPDAYRMLAQLGVHSIGESRLANLVAAAEVMPETEFWFLRLPHLSAVDDVVRLSDASLNSELEIILALNEAAKRQGKVHGVVIMIELGDLREGILPSSLVSYYERIFRLEHIRVLGIGANLGCLSGVVPNVDQLTQLVLYRELLELKFNRQIPFVSAGTSAVLPLLQRNQVPRRMNHFRIGESIFLGTDLLGGGSLPGLRDDAVTVEAEIVEIKEKSLYVSAEPGGLAPFDFVQSRDLNPGQRGFRAIVTVGQVDTEVSGLTPLNAQFSIAGASSDLTVVNLGESPIGVQVGDLMRFRPNYASLVRLMNNRYTEKVFVPCASVVDEEEAPYRGVPASIAPMLHAEKAPLVGLQAS